MPDELEKLGGFASGLGAVLERTGDSPWALAGRAIGLGQAEMQAGVPKWAWFGVGVIAGAGAMWLWGDRLKARLRPSAE